MKELQEERKQITGAAERRAAILKEIGTGVSGRVTRTFQTGAQEQRTFGVDTPEYRSAWLKNLQGKTLDAEERAAVTASAAIPTQTMNRIIHRLELTPMIAAVDVTYIPGNVTFPLRALSTLPAGWPWALRPPTALTLSPPSPWGPISSSRRWRSPPM